MKKQAPAFVKNSADVEQVNQAKSKEYVQEQRYIEGLKQMLGSPAARRTLWKWLAFTNARGQSYIDRNSSAVMFNEGQRSVGLMIEKEIQDYVPEIWLEMQREYIGGKYE